MPTLTGVTTKIKRIDHDYIRLLFHVEPPISLVNIEYSSPIGEQLVKTKNFLFDRTNLDHLLNNCTHYGLRAAIIGRKWTMLEFVNPRVVKSKYGLRVRYTYAKLYSAEGSPLVDAPLKGEFPCPC